MSTMPAMSQTGLQALVRSIEELRESRKETDRVLRRSKEETDQAIKEMAGVFTTQWSKLVETLVELSCVEQF